METDLADEAKQKLAMEMNLSETAFVVPIPDVDVSRGDDENVFKSGKKFSLRWFTPMVEVPLCGHATLASAAVLFYVMDNQQVSSEHKCSNSYPLTSQLHFSLLLTSSQIS